MSAKCCPEDYDFWIDRFIQNWHYTYDLLKKLFLSLIASALSSTSMLAQPVITNQPTSQVVWAGGNAAFTVGISADGPFTCQWQFNSNNLPNGIITTVVGNGSGGFSGDDVAASIASLFNPWGLAVDVGGNLFIADTYNFRIRKVNTFGIITTVVGNGGTPNFSGDGGPATNACLAWPYSMALDVSGNLFIADTYHQCIREVSTNGIITTVAGIGVNANSGSYSGDGGAATNATLNLPSGVTVDAYGNLFIADTGNSRIRKVSSNGIITTVAGNGTNGFSGDGGAATIARLASPKGVVVDTVGNLFIADTYNARIREVNTNGIINTFAGGGNGAAEGAATNAALGYTQGVAVDAIGNLFIADAFCIREVSTNGIITTVAGNGLGSFFDPYYTGDGGAAINAALSFPSDVAVDSAGNLFIAEINNERIRKVTNTQGPILLLNNLTATNAGNYQVVVTCPSGSVTSSVAMLTVILPPTSFTAQIGGSGLQIQLAGTPNYPYILQSATNLTPPVNWQPIVTNPADVNGNLSWTITNLSAVPAGYYRAAAQ